MATWQTQHTERHHDPLDTAPPLDRLTTALAAAITALIVAAGASAQTPPACTSQTCVVTIKNVSPVVDGCGDHATPGQMKVTWASSQSVTYNQGKTGRYATLFPPKTVPNVPVDPADETRTRNNLPRVTFVVPSTEHRGSEFTDWEWRNVNTNDNTWQSAPPRADALLGFPSQIGEHIYEVRPKAGARIWSDVGEMVVQLFQLGTNTSFATSGKAYFMFMGGKGCARVNHAGRAIGGIQ